VPEVRVLPTADEVAAAALPLLREEARRAVASRGRFALALSGGRTPRALYHRLAAAGPEALPYDRVEIFWGDERAVPPDHPASNFRLAYEAWLRHVPVPPERLHRIRGEEAPEAAARTYEAELLAVLNDPPTLDCVLLGIGEDGHIASLFPGSAALRSARYVEATRAPAPPTWRITLTPRALALARRVLVLATGRAKAPAVARALGGAGTAVGAGGAAEQAEVPAAVLRDLPVLWLLDRAAAAVLAPGPTRRSLP
jgi:6-phosphogluconolactonase